MAVQVLRKPADGSAEERRNAEMKQHTSRFPPNKWKAARSVAITIALIIAFSIWILVRPGILPTLLMAGAIVRVFIVFHDASHGALLQTRAGNFFVGRLCQPLLSRSMEGWSESHNRHHKIVGSDPPPKSFPEFLLTGEIYDDSRTVLFSLQAYQNYSFLKKAWVRCFRDPFFFHMVIIPLQWPYRPQEWVQVLQHAAIETAFYKIGGYDSWICYFTACWLALVIAGLLFHLQHQVNPGYWKDEAHGHKHEDACLKGCSLLLVPFWLKWVTLGIEFHHIHHLSPRVPCYELQACHEAADAAWFTEVTEVSMLKAFRSCFHSMWDERTSRYVSFDVYSMLGLQD